MRHRSRFPVWLGLPALAGSLAAAASTLPPAPAAGWNLSAAVETAAGHRDNLLLSAAAEERSGFVHGAAELLLLRTPGGAVEPSFFLQAEGKRFGSGRTVRQESSAWLQADAAWRPSPSWRWSLPLAAFHDQRVFDVSDTDVERLIAETRALGVLGGPRVRWSPGAAWDVEAQAAGDRVRYADGVNDSGVARGLLRVAWRPAAGWEAGLSGWRRERAYDHRLNYSAAGRPLAGTRLRITEGEGELTLRARWGRDERGTATTRMAVLRVRDNGSGYFDHRERRVEQEFEWSGETWKVKLEGSFRRVAFDVQTVGLGLAPPPRRRDGLEAALRVERQLGDGWSWFTAGRAERSRSNDFLRSYGVKEGLIGLRRSWER